MNLNNIICITQPFKHWEVNNCIDNLTLDEISNCTLPEGTRAYDGTRAADHTGDGQDGKLRLFITKENSNHYPNLTKLIKKFQSLNFAYQKS